MKEISMSTYEKLIYIIRKEMKAQKVNSSHIGNLLGLGRETVCHKLNMHRKFYLEEIIKICDSLGLEITITKKGQSNE